MKTVRFSSIVETCGRPHVHTLWTSPEKDQEFKRARSAHRVMTLVGEPGKADFGIVGYGADHASSQFLLFPRSLREFEGAHVVGIKFELVEQPKLAAVDADSWAAASPRHSKKKAPSLPAPARATSPISAGETPGSSRRHRPPGRAKRETKPPPEHDQKPSDHTLLREVHAALKELEHGKTVAAYRRLQRAVT